MANPTINQNGTATITPSQNCTITTSNGASSTINTVNTSNSNNLMVVISGVPAATGVAVFVNGQPSPYLNGLFTIPANSPGFAVVIFGNLLGAVITIQNNTSTAVPASASITCVTA